MDVPQPLHFSAVHAARDAETWNCNELPSNGWKKADFGGFSEG